MSEPTYNGTGLIFATDDSSPYYTDVTAMGATPRGTSPRWMPAASPAYNGQAVDTTRNALVEGKGGPGTKAYQAIYPAGTTTESAAMVLGNASGGVSLSVDKIHVFRCQQRFDGDLGGIPFAIKNARCDTVGYTGGAAVQFSTHDHLPWGSASDVGTFFQAYWGFADSISAYPNGHDQGTQPIGPKLEALINTGWRRCTYAHRSHRPEYAADGVTKLQVTLTGDDATKVATAVFSDPTDPSATMAGKLTNGQYIGLASFTGLNKPLASGGVAAPYFGAFIVSNFDGVNTCTLTAHDTATANCFRSTPTATTYCLDFSKGLMRMWVDGTKIIDVSLAAVGQPVAGGTKQWCGIDMVRQLGVDAPNHPTDSWHMGGAHSGNTAPNQVTETVNLGDGDPTNLDTSVWFTLDSLDDWSVGGAPDHLGLTQQPSASTPSGQAHAQQPAGVIQDSTNATVTGDTTTVTATLVLESGTGTARGTTAVQCVAGAFSFAGTGLGVDSAGGCTAHWDLSRPGLPTVSTASFTITPPPVASVPFRSHRAAIL